MWDLKGTASGCLGYLFLSNAMGCLEIQASYVLNATARTGSILLHLPESGVCVDARTHPQTKPFVDRGKSVLGPDL